MALANIRVIPMPGGGVEIWRLKSELRLDSEEPISAAASKATARR